jgi:hypothetical protein
VFRQKVGITRVVILHFFVKILKVLKIFQKKIFFIYPKNKGFLLKKWSKKQTPGDVLREKEKKVKKS